MRYFRQVGWDGSTFIWWTPSRSRPGHEGHEVCLDRDGGWMWCSCEACVYGKMECRLHDAQRVGCWHMRTLAAALLRGTGL